MSVAAIVLSIAAAGLLVSLSLRREGVLMAGIVGYTAVLLWLMRADMELLPPALGIALVFGVVAVGRRLRAELVAPPPGGRDERHNSSKMATTH